VGGMILLTLAVILVLKMGNKGNSVQFKTKGVEREALTVIVTATGTLEPTNGLLAEAARLAALTRKTAPTLLTWKFGGIDAISDQPSVYVIPRQTGDNDNPTRFLYVINADTRNAVAGTVSLSVKSPVFTGAVDVFTDRKVAVNNETAPQTLSYDLQPGAATLLKFVEK